MKEDQLTKLLKRLGKSTVEEMSALNSEDLKATIVQAESSMKEAKVELEANEKYQEAKEVVKLLSQGKREVDKRQKDKIAYSLHLLEDKGAGNEKS